MKKPQDRVIKSSFFLVKEGSWGWKVMLAYDVIMMILIVFNLFCLATNAILMGEFAQWLFETLYLSQVLDYYKQHLHHWVIITEGWFTTFLIIELLVRWVIASVYHHHHRWWFFPFVHWYEILAIIPQFRFLRLFRAVAIAYNLHSHGYSVIPQSWYARGNFYYNLLLEELTSRVVLTVINQVQYELKTSTTHRQLITELINQHRDLFAQALTEVLQHELATQLQQNRHMMAKNVGLVVNRAIEDTPELTQLLRLIPIVGSRIEQQIQSIGQRLGENITQGLIEPFTPQSPHGAAHPTYHYIAKKVSQISLEHSPHIEKLVESAVFDALNALSHQVKVKQWQQMLKQEQTAKQ